MEISTLAWRYVRERTDRKEVAPKSALAYRCALLRFARDVGDPDVRRLNRRLVERWLGTRGKVVSSSTLAGNLSALRGFCSWLVRHRYLRADPTRDIASPVRPRRLPRNLETAAVATVFDSAPDRRAELVISLAVQEGLRCSEIATLELGDIDGQRRMMKVQGKGQRDRIVPITTETWAALMAYLDEHPAATGPVVRSYNQPNRGLSGQYLSRLGGAWMYAAGVKQRPRDGRSLHALRHTAATDMLDAGANVRNVQHLLGHASLATTQVYLAWVIGNLRAEMEGRHYRGVQAGNGAADDVTRPVAGPGSAPTPAAGRATEDMPQSRTNGRAADAAPPNGRWAEPGQPAQLRGNGGPPRLPNENEAPADAGPRWEEP